MSALKNTIRQSRREIVAHLRGNGSDVTVETALGHALERAGVLKPRAETPSQAAERIWKETKHDPIKTMQLFDAWAREDVTRVLCVVGEDFWKSRVRCWLADERNKYWRHVHAFLRAIKLIRRDFKSKEIATSRGRAREELEKFYQGESSVRPAKSLLPSYDLERARVGRLRKKHGIKIVSAAVDIKTGEINLIDRAYGPFAHIRINGLELPKVTTEQALRYCDNQTNDVRFVRALCGLIPDPRKPIGEQWTANMIREAKRIAGAE